NLLDLGEKLDALRRELEVNPPTTIGQAVGRINQLLGSAAAVAMQGRVLQFGLNYGISKTVQLPLSFDLADNLNAGILKEFLHVGAPAPRTLAIGGSLALGLVIALPTPTSPVLSLTDSSRINLTTLVNAPNIGLQASIGPLGITISGGRVSLDRGTVGTPA